MGLRSRRIAEQSAVRAEVASLCRHPLFSLGADRNARDAYFHGLVFAALANDEVVTEEERRMLSDFAPKLGFRPSAVDAVIDYERAVIENEDENELMKDCMHVLRSPGLAELFLKDFDLVWNVGDGDEGELEAWHCDFGGWLLLGAGERDQGQEFSSARSRLLNCLGRRREGVCVCDVALARASVGYDDALEDRDSGDDLYCAEDSDQEDGHSSAFLSNVADGFDDVIEDRED